MGVLASAGQAHSLRRRLLGGRRGPSGLFCLELSCLLHRQRVLLALGLAAAAAGRPRLAGGAGGAGGSSEERAEVILLELGLLGGEGAQLALVGPGKTGDLDQLVEVSAGDSHTGQAAGGQAHDGLGVGGQVGNVRLTEATELGDVLNTHVGEAARHGQQGLELVHLLLVRQELGPLLQVGAGVLLTGLRHPQRPGVLLGRLTAPSSTSSLPCNARHRLGVGQGS